MILNPQFINDEKGRKIFVVLSLKEYNWAIEKIEELEDNRIYEMAKKKDDGQRILLQDYLKSRK